MRRTVIIFCTLAVCFFLSACDVMTEKKDKREFYFSTRGVTFTVGDDADAFLCVLGEPNCIRVAPSCAGVGEDELYIYDGFRIYAHRDDKQCRVSVIELTNDTVMTAEGAKIGDSRERLKALYGEGVEKNGSVEYLGNLCRLCFSLCDGRVSLIKYIPIDG